MKKPIMSMRTDVKVESQCELFVEKYSHLTNEEFEKNIPFFEENNPVIIDGFLVSCAITAKENNWSADTCVTIAFAQFCWFERAVDSWFKENYKEANWPNVASSYKACYVCALAEGLNTLWGKVYFTSEIFASMYAQLKESVRRSNNKVMLLDKKSGKDDLGLADFLKQSIN